MDTSKNFMSKSTSAESGASNDFWLTHFSQESTPKKASKREEIMEENKSQNSIITKPFWSEHTKIGINQEINFLFRSNVQARADTHSMFRTSKQAFSGIQGFNQNNGYPRCQLFADTRENQVEQKVSIEAPLVFILDREDQTYEFPSISSKALAEVMNHHASENNDILLINKSKSLVDKPTKDNLSQSSTRSWYTSAQCFELSTGDDSNLQQEGTAYIDKHSGHKYSIFSNKDDTQISSSSLDQQSMPAEIIALSSHSHYQKLQNSQIDDLQVRGTLNISAIDQAEFPCKLLVIDCRYSFEYVGGHIRSAINIGSPLVVAELFGKYRECLHNSDFLEELVILEGKSVEIKDLERAYILASHRVQDAVKTYKEVLLKKDSSEIINELEALDPFCSLQNLNPVELPRNCIPVIVFHCEFSSKRAPSAWRLARTIDRHFNLNNHPKLDFPQMYVLKDGYEKFVACHGMSCSPVETYTRMLSSEHREELRAADRRRSSEMQFLKISKQHLPPHNCYNY